MAVELGSAYLSIGASTDKLAKDVKRALGDLEPSAARAGKRGGSALGKGISRGLKVIGGGIAGVTALVGGLALKGGISRALNIEDARAKLKGLGHDTQSIETIMDNALASVKGTAFGLGDAATVAASAVAAGIEPGENLERVLSSVANAAAAAGTDLTDMGAIYNDAATQNKATNRILQQVAQRGLPIYEALADQLGVTAEEVFKLASAGKIGFAEFEQAMTDASGTVAAEMGDTLRGRIDNTMAALGRLGEKVVEGVLPQISDGLGSMIDVLDSWAPAAEKVGEAIGKALRASIDFMKNEVVPVIRDVAGWFRNDALPAAQDLGKALNDHVVPALKGVVDWVKENRTWLEPLTVAVVAAAGAWKLVTGAIAAVKGLAGILSAAKVAAAGFTAVLAANPIGIVVTAIAALVAGLTWFFTQTETGKKIWQGFTEFLSRAWEGVKAAFAPVVDWFKEHVVPLVQSIAEAWWAYIQRIGEIWKWLWDSAIKPVVDLIVEGVKILWDAVKAAWERYGQPFIDAAKAAWETIAAVAEMAWNGIKNTVETALGVIKGVIDAVTSALRGDWSGAWEAIKGAAERAWEGIKNAVRIAVDGVTKIFGGLKDTILNALSGIGTWLLDAGRWLVEGLLNGIKGAWNTVTGWLGDAANGLVGTVKGVLGIRSPSRRFAEIGRWISKGLAKGIADSGDEAVKALTDLSKRLLDEGGKSAKGAARLVREQTKRTGATRSQLLAGLTGSGKVRSGKAGKVIEGFTLADIAKAREQVAKSLDAARDTLRDLKAARRDLRDQIASSIKGELDLAAGLGESTTDAYGRQSGGKTTFKSVAAQVKTLAAKAKTFATLLNRLVKAGIPAGLVQEVASLGTEKGIEVARALLSGSKSQIRSLAADYASLEKYSKKAGSYVAGAMYDTAIAAQEGLIKGLEADDAKLEKAAERLAKKLEKAVKKALGIKSPSRVFRDEVGTQLVAGVIAGIDDEQAALDARVAGMVRTPQVPSVEAKAGNDRTLTDADIEALAKALTRTPIVARAYLDDREARKVTQKGIQEIRRTDPAVLR